MNSGVAVQANAWEKLRIGSTAAGAVLIPLVVGVIGWQVNASLKERDAQVQMIEMAVDILQSQPDPETGSGLREWAVEVIDRHSGVGLSEAARMELLKQPLPAGAQAALSKVESMMKVIEQAIPKALP